MSHTHTKVKFQKGEGYQGKATETENNMDRKGSKIRRVHNDVTVKRLQYRINSLLQENVFPLEHNGSEVQ